MLLIKLAVSLDQVKEEIDCERDDSSYSRPTKLPVCKTSIYCLRNYPKVINQNINSLFIHEIAQREVRMSFLETRLAFHLYAEWVYQAAKLKFLFFNWLLIAPEQDPPNLYMSPFPNNALRIISKLEAVITCLSCHRLSRSFNYIAVF